jgi:hypothetical protein
MERRNSLEMVVDLVITSEPMREPARGAVVPCAAHHRPRLLFSFSFSSKKERRQEPARSLVKSNLTRSEREREREHASHQLRRSSPS